MTTPSPTREKPSSGTTLTRLKLRPDDVSELKGKIDGLNKQAGELDTWLGVLDGEIYTQASPGAKRRIFNIIIEEIRCTVKREDWKGDMVHKLSGDGPVRREREQARKQEDPKPPSSGGSSLQGAWLRERLENSNYILLKIPIEIHNLGHGQRLICMDSERLPEELGLGEEAIQGLLQAGLVRLRPQKPRPKERIDYTALQQTYRRMLVEGPFSRQTELARHLGVSRVWVCRVLKGVKRNDGHRS